MDKQLNARINPNLHNQIKTLSTDTKIIMNTLVETLLEIGLKHYQSASVLVDSDRNLTQNDLQSLEDRLKKLESMIGNFAHGQTNQVEQIELLCISKQAIATVANNDVHNIDSYLYPVGAKVKKFDLSKYLGFHHNNYSVKAKAKGLTTEQYVNYLAQAKGEQWQELVEGNAKYFLRVK